MTMVGMVVSPENGIYLGNVGRKQLRAQICRSVHKDSLACIVLDDDGHAAAAVPGFLRIAFTPIVANTRHARRRARAEHYELHEAALLNKR